MKKFAAFFAVGVLFGITLTKAEVISWYRIHEMFHFESFHMYGIMGSAVACGILGIAFIKKKKLTSWTGEAITFVPKRRGLRRYLWGGTLFGIGWALVGACPGPIYILIGYGYSVIAVVLLAAIAGTWVYGLIHHRLPH